MVSLALIVELSGARGVSRLRRCNGFCTLRLYLPADWAQKNIMAKNLSRQIQNSCERFVLHVFLGLSRQRAGPMAHAWTSTRLRFLLLGDVISSHLPASLAVGMAVGMAGAAAPPRLPPLGLRMRPPDGKAGGAAKEMATQTSGECRGTPFHVSAQLLEQ